MNLDQILKELGKEGDIPNLENNELNVDNTEKKKRAEELYIEDRYGIPLKEYEALEKIYNQIKPKEDFDTFYIKDQRIHIERDEEDKKGEHVVYLYLARLKLCDINPIENLKNLKVLNLDETQVSDISPIKNLVNLKELHLRKMTLNDISPVKYLKNLEKLYLNSTQVNDISPIENLENLKILNLKGSYVNPSDLTTKSIIDQLKQRGIKLYI